MISVFGSLVGDEELAEVRSVLESQWMGLGAVTQRFEEEFAERIGIPGLTMLGSGTDGLYLAVRLLDLPEGSEVIVPSFTWVSCAHAVVLAGCVPVFCDVELETQNVSAATVAPCITPRTGAVMVVHYAGKPVDVPAIAALGLPVIEDCAHAVDSRLGGRPCGVLGDLGVYSFDSVKNLATPEGGGLTAQSAELRERATRLRYCGVAKSGFAAAEAHGGRWWEYDIAVCYPKLIPNDVCAAIGLAQLRKLDANQQRRKAIWDHYQREFADVPWLAIPADAGPDERHSYFTYAVRVAAGARDRLATYLFEHGIYTTLRFHPLHLNPVYGSSAKLPVSERLNEEGLCVPLHPRLSDEDVSTVVETVRAFVP
jgi:dTDP-4-amino-4,6-dideoxygalactose transaminase